MSNVQIVTSPTCGYCHAAKNLFDRAGVSYQEIDLFQDHEQGSRLMSVSGQRTVPQIFINKKSIGGYTDLQQLIRNNDIDLKNLQDF